MTCNPRAPHSQPSHYTEECENSSLEESLTPKTEQYLLAFSCLYLFLNFSSTTHGIFPNATHSGRGLACFPAESVEQECTGHRGLLASNQPFRRTDESGPVLGSKSTVAWHIHRACALLFSPAFGMFVSCQNPMMLICYLRS